MSRNKGQTKIPANFEPTIGGSFDARSITGKKADLTDSTQWNVDEGDYRYPGMVVSVYDDTDDNNGIYRCKNDDFNNSNSWEKIGSGDKIQFTTLPTPTPDLLGKIYHYVGVKNEAQGLYPNNFYKCVQDGVEGGKWVPAYNYVIADSLETSGSVLPLGTLIYVLDDSLVENNTLMRHKGTIYVVEENESVQIFKGNRNSISPISGTMPEASLEWYDAIVIYLGTDQSVYKQGNIYQCGQDGEGFGWILKNQASGGSISSGDMLKSVYDTNNDGKVDNADNADKLDGQLSSYYATSANLTKEISDRIAAEDILTQNIATVSTKVSDRGQIWSLEQLDDVNSMGNSGIYLIRDNQNIGEANVVLQTTGMSTQTYYSYDGKILYRETPNFTWGEWQDITPASGAVEWKVDNMPIANEDNLGKIVTYIGTETLYAYYYIESSSLFFRKTEATPINNEPSYDVQGQLISSNNITAWVNYIGRLVNNSLLGAEAPSYRCDVFDIKSNRTYICSKVGNAYRWLPLKTDLKIEIATQGGSNYIMELSPNVYYKVTPQTNLDNIVTFKLLSLDSSKYEEYMLELDYSIGNGSIAFPDTIKFATDPIFEYGKTYQISIVNNLGIIGEWSNE